MPVMDIQSGIFQNEFRAGPDQRIVVYHITDTGEELNPTAIFSEIAEDASKRAEQGQRIVAMSSLDPALRGLLRPRRQRLRNEGLGRRRLRGRQSVDQPGNRARRRRPT
jgi:hypothetical protein